MVLVLVALHQGVTHVLFGDLSNVWHAVLEWVVYGLTGSVVAWLGLTWVAQAVARQAQDAAKLRQAHADLAQIRQWLLSIHEIGREAVNAADPLEVLELAARAPVQLAGARGTAVFTFDDEKQGLKLEMTWGLGDTYIQALRRRVETGIPAERCRGCVPLTARITSNCPLFQDLQAQARADGIATLVCLPLMREQERVGIISAYFASPEGPSEMQLHLLTIVGTEMAAVLDGVRLRAQQMAALATVGRVAQGSGDLDTFLGPALEAIIGGWGIEAGAIFLSETLAESDRVDGTAPTGVSMRQGILRLAQDTVWYCRVQRGLGDDLADPRFGLAMRLSEEARASGQPAPLAQSQAGGDCPFASAVAVPLVAEGEILGTLFLASTRARALLLRQMPFMTLLAHQMALAVRNARLHLRVSHLAMLEERYRLAREMHDGLAQTLSYLGWQMDHLEMLLRSGRLEPLAVELTEARRTVREAYLDVREAIDGLRLAVEHPGGLAAALQEYVADFSTRTGIPTDFETHGDGPALAPIAEVQLLHIAQEALTNVRKHSGAQHAQVRLLYTGDNWELIVADDGRGFEPTLPRRHHRWGLATMRERAHSLGGSLIIATGPGQGTRITATVPASRNSR